MLNTLVTFYSQTGNTEKIAKAIYQSVPEKKDLKSLSEVDNTDIYDLIFIGFPIYNFEPPSKVKEFILQHLKEKSIVLFITMSLTSVPKDEQMTALYDFTIKNCKSCAQISNILGVFDCPGELSDNTSQALIKSPDPQLKAFGLLRDFTIGYPKEENISEAKRFAVRIFKDYEEGRTSLFSNKSLLRY